MCNSVYNNLRIPLPLVFYSLSISSQKYRKLFSEFNESKNNIRDKVAFLSALTTHKRIASAINLEAAKRTRDGDRADGGVSCPRRGTTNGNLWNAV